MNSGNLEIQLTADGSATLYRADIDEHYHSVRGALAESLHVYVDCGLRHRALMDGSTDTISVLEVGFGTGLNAAVSVDAVEANVCYTSVELFPPDPQQVRALGYTEQCPWIEAVVDAPWDKDVVVAPRFTLCKRLGDFHQLDLAPESIDVVYFDAFAPEKQPDMWTVDVFGRLYKAMRRGGVLTTYCAKGSVRRMLEAIGFTIERLPGPPGGKREILRGTKKN